MPRIAKRCGLWLLQTHCDEACCQQVERRPVFVVPVICLVLAFMHVLENDKRMNSLWALVPFVSLCNRKAQRPRLEIVLMLSKASTGDSEPSQGIKITREGIEASVKRLRLFAESCRGAFG